MAYFKVYRYNNNTQGGQGIWVVKSDGSGDTQITFPDTGSSDSSLQFKDSEPRWSPDGTKIVFDRYTYSDGYYNVNSMNADGSGVTNLTSGGTSSNIDPSWSPDGSRIVYTHFVSGSPQTTVMGADGTNKHSVMSSGTCSTYSQQPGWSPDGSRIYYWGTCSSDMKLLYVTSTDNFATAANSTEHALYTASHSVSHLRVSSDGVYIYYDGVNTTHIYKLNTSTGAETTISPGSNIYNEPDSFGAAWPSAPAPGWWNGTTCDTAHNSGSSPLTHSGVTTTFYGVTACGGGNINGVSTTFGGESVSENEWQCTELVLRYMDLRWGVQNYVADGYQIVSNYSGTIMTKVTNTGSNLPSVGDVISFNRVSPYDTAHGHTAIVTAVSGSSITTMEQNNGSTGVGTVTVSGGGVSTTKVNGWLHHS